MAWAFRLEVNDDGRSLRLSLLDLTHRDDESQRTALAAVAAPEPQVTSASEAAKFKAEAAREPTTFESLSDDLLVHIIAFLSLQEQLSSVAMCHRLNLALDENFWRAQVSCLSPHLLSPSSHAAISSSPDAERVRHIKQRERGRSWHVPLQMPSASPARGTGARNAPETWQISKPAARLLSRDGWKKLPQPSIALHAISTG